MYVHPITREIPMTTQSTVAIVGMGSSGQSAAKLALILGHDVLCIDRNECQVPEGCSFSLEGSATLENVSMVVVSPGVPSHNSVTPQKSCEERFRFPDVVSCSNANEEFASGHYTNPMTVERKGNDLGSMLAELRMGTIEVEV